MCRDSVNPIRVTEMLFMRDDVPQGVHRCLDELQANLAAVANDQSAETLRRVGELHAQFHYGRFEELCAGGIPVFLDRFQEKLRDVGARIPMTSWRAGAFPMRYGLRWRPEPEPKPDPEKLAVGRWLASAAIRRRDVLL